MKYFLDTEFIEGFHKPMFGKNRHFIDLISIGIINEEGKTYYAISNEYNYNDANEWVKENVILPMYLNIVHGDARNNCSVHNFHKHWGKSNETIKNEILLFTNCWRDQLFYRAPEGIEVYGYYSDYDWVLFCSLFGRMMDLPKGFPMYCNDLKQTLDEKVKKTCLASEEKFEVALKRWKEKPLYPKQQNEHNALADAKWNKELYDFLQTII